jgi:hypothetical protein
MYDLEAVTEYIKQKTQADSARSVYDSAVRARDEQQERVSSLNSTIAASETKMVSILMGADEETKGKIAELTK